MKEILVGLGTFLFAAALTAQVETGSIHGTVTDPAGNPLPGVWVRLRGPQLAPLGPLPAPLPAKTDAQGRYRFDSIPPGSDYEISAEMGRFETTTRAGIVVRAGEDTEIVLIMEFGSSEELVETWAIDEYPEGQSFQRAGHLKIDWMWPQLLPSARDPWAILQLAPSVLVDRENVGGNESGEPASFVARGDTSGQRLSSGQGANNVWRLDGVDVSDLADLGRPALVPDFDMIQELDVTVGGAADVTVQTGGVVLNMVTRRGGNRMSLAGRFYLTDNFFQSTNITPELQAQGVLDTNKIQQIKDYGLNAGGPIIKDKLWWWGAYGVQDIFTWTLPSRTGIGVTTPAAKNQALLNTYNFKINALILAANRFEALVTSGARELFGRNASPEKPDGDHQTGKYHWGSPIFKLQDEHVFGNSLYLILKYSFNDAGFSRRPIPDESVQYPIVYDNTLSKYVPYGPGMNASWGSYGVSRPRKNYQIQGTYFNDTFLGLSHEIKFGAEYSHKKQSTRGDDTGNIQGFDITRNYNDLALDANADGIRSVPEMTGWERVSMYRRSGSALLAQQGAAFIQDTIVKGNFTLSLGLRFDKQWSGQGAYIRDAVLPGTPAWDRVFTSETSAILERILPDVTVDPYKGFSQIVNGADRPYQWNVLSPRLGLTWDIAGDGKTVARLGLSQYGDIMGVGWMTPTPYGTGGTVRFWWRDADSDRLYDWDELYWDYSSRYPWADPAFPGLPYRYVPYRVFANAEGALTAEAYAMLHDGSHIFDSDAYHSGQLSGFDWYNGLIIDLDTGSPAYFWDRAAQSSPRTREVLLTLEREILPDFSAALSFCLRRYDRFMQGYTYWPAEHRDEYPGMWDVGETPTDIILDEATINANGWYTEVGTIPDTFYIGGTFTGTPATGYTWAVNASYPEGDPRRGTQYSSNQAAGRSYWLPAAGYPTISSRYTLYNLNDDCYTYTGVDLVLNKRLSNRWMMNASFTWQAQKSYWGDDFVNSTNRWAFDGQPYGDWGGAASGKQAALMYTRWMVKLSGLYQLPWGINISATFNAREGWRVPHYFTLYDHDAPNYTAGYGNTIYTQLQTDDALPLFYNITFRLEKRINIGAGRMYLMADVFNLLNSNIPIRSYPYNMGSAYFRWAGPEGAETFQQYSSSYYNYTGFTNEILNPRVWRFGVRFEF
jgi:hypothetical protein